MRTTQLLTMLVVLQGLMMVHAQVLIGTSVAVAALGAALCGSGTGVMAAVVSMRLPGRDIVVPYDCQTNA